MTTYLWSTLSDGQVISSFNPAGDVLRFDDLSIAAAALAVLSDAESTSTMFVYGGKTITIQFDERAITTANVTFENGSLLLVGDNTVGTANDDANNLFFGGNGNDQFVGFDGNDFYSIDNTGDVIVENLDDGDDLVGASVTYTLPTNVENMVLNGSSAIDGIGNALRNVITGNSSANVIDGGAGDDVLAGDAGVDTLLGGSGDDGLNGGSGGDSLNGGTGNDILDGGTGADTMRGEAGNDSYFVDNNGDTAVEKLNDGRDQVLASITYTLADNFENLALTGSADINGSGNALDNSINGNSGNNTLDGGGGADIMSSGTGDDTYIVDNAGDFVVEFVNDGIDQVTTSVTYALTANVENLTLAGTAAIAGTGNALDNRITGNAANNTLTGGGGNDVLDGGVGQDSMLGGIGNDTYAVDNAADFVAENFGEGVDLILARVTYSLSSNVENLTLTAAADIGATGNALDNIITGNGGSNALDGGAGADIMGGGAGDDSYFVENLEDIVNESENEGADRVIAATSYTLPANVENLTLTGNGATTGTGNSLDNAITGNGSSNTLNGGTGNDVLSGGAGADMLFGGAGNDAYIVEDISDLVSENAGEGSDLVSSLITYTLSANVENLALIGTGAINGTGNALDNVITGNAANNTVSGGAGNDVLDGGAGTDVLVGGSGDDAYLVDDVTDVTTEQLNEGADVVSSFVAYTLTANVESLILIGGGANGGTGNELDNSITGNGADNTLRGAAGNDLLDGGAGADTLVGNAGDDTYVVDNIADQIVEDIGEGVDLVSSLVTYSLSENVENLTLIGVGDIGGTGNARDNSITGNSGGNILIGGRGNDSLLGGLGLDIARFSGNRSDYTLRKTGASVTVTGPDGTDTLTGIEKLQFSDALIRLGGSPSIDTNGDGKNDILWRRDEGTVSVWTMNGGPARRGHGGAQRAAELHDHRRAR